VAQWAELPPETLARLGQAWEFRPEPYHSVLVASGEILAG